MNTNILTRPNYWTSCPESTKAMWQALANRTSVIVCTHRPDLRDNRGAQQVRRCSTGGKWGRSADVCSMSVERLLASGYVWRTYTPASVRLAAKRDAVYSDGSRMNSNA